MRSMVSRAKAMNRVAMMNAAMVSRAIVSRAKVMMNDALALPCPSGAWCRLLH